MKTKPEAIALIEVALAAVPAAVHKKWLKLDKLPYIHATDDPNANPYSSPVVGRFDYMETADYILSCNPANMREVISHIAAQDAEIARLLETVGQLNQSLNQIGDLAHDKSTGPAVPDAYWDIRQMAYEGQEEVALTTKGTA